MAAPTLAPIPYHDYQTQPDILLPWHQGKWGTRWNGSLGLLKDMLAEGATQAVRARWISKAPPDALALIGRALGWPQAPGELTSEYRNRLSYTWQLAIEQGTELGIVDAFGALGLTNVEVKESFTSGWGRALDGGSIAPEKSRWIWVVVRPPHPFGNDYSFAYGDGATWGALPTGSGKLWGINGDTRLITLLRQLVRKQKPAHTFCEWIAIVLDGDIKEANASDDGSPTTGSKVVYISI